MKDEEVISLLKAIIDTAIDGIININRFGTIEKINPAALKIFGYQRDEILGKSINMLMPSPDRERHDGYINNYMKTRKPKIIGIGREVIGLKKNGEQFPFRLAVSEVILNDRVLFTGVIHDLSDVKIVQKKLEETNENLEQIVTERTYELENVANKLLARERELKVALEKEKELGKLKTRFVSMASHEFRTPLTSILSSATIISKYTKQDQQENREKHIERIKSAVTNLTGILNDFLSITKLEEKNIEAQPESVNLKELLEEVFQECKAIIKEGRTLSLSQSGVEREVFIDRRILKNILFNLISNALKYSFKNTEIITEISYEEERFSISVSNQGMGIPEEEQKHLFTRFFRAENAMNIQGTGLGLSIVKQYLKILNGDISVYSEPGKETVFKVVFPTKK